MLLLIASICRIQEDHSIVSFTVSDDGRYALLNISEQVQYVALFFATLFTPLSTDQASSHFKGGEIGKFQKKLCTVWMGK